MQKQAKLPWFWRDGNIAPHERNLAVLSLLFSHLNREMAQKSNSGERACETVFIELLPFFFPSVISAFKKKMHL